MCKWSKGIRWTSLTVLVALLLSPAAAFAENSGFHETASRVCQVRYSETRKISALLSINGNIATCYGAVTPMSDQNCTITVILYKKNGTKWVKEKSWSSDASGGQSATVKKTQKISRGTYKVVAIGKVAGETTRAETAEKTY